MEKKDPIDRPYPIPRKDPTLTIVVPPCDGDSCPRMTIREECERIVRHIEANKKERIVKDGKHQGKSANLVVMIYQTLEVLYQETNPSQGWLTLSTRVILRAMTKEQVQRLEEVRVKDMIGG